MYFNLPKSSERQKTLNKKSSNSSLISTESSTNTTTVMAEDRISEIIHNLDDHWGSPPILTPDTLAHILNHQWIHHTEEEEGDQYIRKTTIKTIQKKVISNLIKEVCKTIQVIDTENKFEVTKDLKNDPIIQKFISSSSLEENEGENILQHLVELLQHHNKHDSVTE